MKMSKKIRVMPTASRYRLMVSFCLSSLIPILSGVYIGSLFIKYPFDMNPLNLLTISMVILFSMLLSFLGHEINKGLIFPIEEATRTAEKIAGGKLEAVPNLRGSDELESLSRNLRTISDNAKELLDQVEKLSLKDKLTGLYKAAYIQERLDEEIRRSVHYQRPCSFVYFHIQSLDEVASKNGAEASENILKAIAHVLGKYLSEFDRAAKINFSEFAIIFTDRNKKSAIEKTERIAAEIKAFLCEQSLNHQKSELKVFAGISENPIDGVIADELYIKAQDRMRLAKTKGMSSVEAFA